MSSTATPSMLTRMPAFTAQDAVELVHAHLARRPRPPHELKEPDQRYQSAEALALDLREARAQWLQAQAIDAFPLADHDVPRKLPLPDKLYGRDKTTDGYTALTFAARWGYLPIVELLLRHGADPCLARADGALARRSRRDVASSTSIVVHGYEFPASLYRPPRHAAK